MKKILSLLFAVLTMLSFTGCLSAGGDSSNHSANYKKKIDTTHVSIDTLQRTDKEADTYVSAVLGSNGLWGYINKKGEWVIEPQFAFADNFSEGLAAVKDQREKYGFIDIKGNYKKGLLSIFDSVTSFSNGIAAVREDGGEWFYIDETGELVFKERIFDFGDNFLELNINNFNYASAFENGYAFVAENNPEENKYYYAVIDVNGKIVLEMSESETKGIAVQGADANGYVIFSDEKSDKILYGVKDIEGNVLIEPEYEDILTYSAGLFTVKKDGKYGFIDKSGNKVIDFIYSGATRFETASALVEYNGKWGIIDKEGKWMLEPVFDKVKFEGFSSGMAAVCVNGKWGFADANGELKVPFAFNDVSSVENGVFSFKAENGKFGFADKDGKIFIEAEFTEVGNFSS